MVDKAVAAGVVDTDDLDWKSELPPGRNLTQTDFPKDVETEPRPRGHVGAESHRRGLPVSTLRSES
jgi:hypothetical protein